MLAHFNKSPLKVRLFAILFDILQGYVSSDFYLFKILSSLWKVLFTKKNTNYEKNVSFPDENKIDISIYFDIIFNHINVQQIEQT